jgi:predicted RecB family nuclease
MMDRQLLIGMIVGFIIGWVVEWGIDFLYWRRRYRKLEQTLSQPRDNLQKIKGIGPEVEKRLNEAGIFSFEQLSRLSQTEIWEIIGKEQTGFEAPNAVQDESDGESE